MRSARFVAGVGAIRRRPPSARLRLRGSRVVVGSLLGSSYIGRGNLEGIVSAMRGRRGGQEAVRTLGGMRVERPRLVMKLILTAAPQLVSIALSLRSS